jgi:hypothetical protein
MAFLFAKSFPFCVQDAGETPTGNGTVYPIGMSLKAVMELFWKCETFNLTGSYALSYFVDPGSRKDYIINDSYSTEVTSLTYWPPKMSDMICSEQPVFYGEGFGTGTIVTTNSDVPQNSQPFFYLQLFAFSGAEVIKKGNLYYPRFALVFAPGFEYGSSYSTFETGNGLYVEAPNFVSVTLGDETFSCSIYAYPRSPYSSSFYPPQDIVFTGSISITKSSDRLAE